MYPVKTIKILAFIDKCVEITANINISGYDNLAKFIENDPAKYLKLTDARIENRYFSFFVLNKDKVIGYTDDTN